MAKAEKGNKVKIHYTGTLADGTVFDSSKDRDPLEFEIGSGQVIPGFDSAVTDMEVDEQKVVTIPAAEAYGERNDQMMIPMPKTQIPEGMEVKEGMMLQLMAPNGMPTQVTVAEIKEEEIILDANHPLAGKDLTFEIKLVSIA